MIDCSPVAPQTVQVAIAEDVHLENRSADTWVVIHRGVMVDENLMPAAGPDQGDDARKDPGRTQFGPREALEIAHRARDRDIHDRALKDDR